MARFLKILINFDNQVKLEPYYYEVDGSYLTFQNSTEDECQIQCYKENICIQCVFNKITKKCDLKKSLNISNAIPVKFNSDLLVKSIKSKIFFSKLLRVELNN